MNDGALRSQDTGCWRVHMLISLQAGLYPHRRCPLFLLHNHRYPENPVAAPEPHIILSVPSEYWDEKQMKIGEMLNQLTPGEFAALTNNIWVFTYHSLFILYTEYPDKYHRLPPPDASVLSSVLIIHPIIQQVNTLF